MRNIKLFDTHSEYRAYISSAEAVHKNVSYCRDMNEVHFDRRYYDGEYLTTEALENGTISFNIWKSMGTNMINSISYSTDNGDTWTTTNNTDSKSEHLVINVNVNQGDKVLWKGTATQTGYDDSGDYEGYVGSFFSSDCEFNAYGNIMSLLYGDDFYNNKNLGNTEGTFAFLFSDYDESKTCEVVSAQNLILPATTMISGCYQGMFYGCTSLTIAPELPATTLANQCYQSMFEGCTSLITAPELPATTLADSCYLSMFNGCTALTTAPELPATTLANSCYQSMFDGCTALTTAPELRATTLALNCYNRMFQNCTGLISVPTNYLHSTTLAINCYNSMFGGCTSLTSVPNLPATTLDSGCYGYMFSGCTSLTTAPVLPATTLASGCYQYMFYACTKLTAAPELPATTLANSCYQGMFQGCTSLTTAPVLPATTLANASYVFMFDGCSNLNYIKAMFTTTPSFTYTSYWVRNVAASGTFVKNSAAQWNVTGVNGVPSGWTVETANE